jgi:hypothetical protein
MYVKQYDIANPRYISSPLYHTIGFGGLENRELIILATVLKTVKTENKNTNKNIVSILFITRLFFFLTKFLFSIRPTIFLNLVLIFLL